ncbi:MULTISPECIES: hypothetical protein [Carboxydothermus]|uniref:Uncharacterized protein n=2 Tax=Carboxydothermus TaxID=129957 RepID=Q3AF68_CARHZ|nr:MULTISPECIES: hypothetical protein [Carboxydothermus]ABB14788.1 hypothetical protein CHY_0353 [Carboxydothermus hydrogenoformans Z-2901]NYE57257.1 hypothetical protein [Carboxydothermus ferrireducens DSM 11255]
MSEREKNPGEPEAIRCRCKKIVAQKNKEEIIIKCRFCKRRVVISVREINGISYTD